MAKAVKRVTGGKVNIGKRSDLDFIQSPAQPRIAGPVEAGLILVRKLIPEVLEGRVPCWF